MDGVEQWKQNMIDNLFTKKSNCDLIGYLANISLGLVCIAAF